MGFSATNGNLPDNTTITLTAGGRLQALGQVPIAGIIPWDKSLSPAPTLPSNFKECDGSTISEPLSAYNGQSIRNLNGVQRMIRGASTSGTTGGADTNTFTFSGTTANHTPTGTSAGSGVATTVLHNHTFSGTTDSGSILSAYMQMVFVQRIY